jgi:hypothetical protein
VVVGIYHSVHSPDEFVDIAKHTNVQYRHSRTNQKTPVTVVFWLNGVLYTYRVLVPLTWALVVVVGIYHSVHSPDDIKKGKKIRRKILHWGVSSWISQSILTSNIDIAELTRKHQSQYIKKGKKIWKQANKHNTPFSQNTTVTGVFWLVRL